MVRENVPAPPGHVCNESWHDDAVVARVRALAAEIHRELDDMFSERRQQDATAYVKRIIDGGRSDGPHA